MAISYKNDVDYYDPLLDGMGLGIGNGAGGGGTLGLGAGLGAGILAGLAGTAKAKPNTRHGAVNLNPPTTDTPSTGEQVETLPEKEATETATHETPVLDQAKNNILYKVEGGTGTKIAGKEDLTNRTLQEPTEDHLDKPEIEDKTNENLEVMIDNQEYIDFLMQMRNEQWAREDQIRAETQAREDNAYQRATEDMIKAGINPNLVGVNPAASGGGITQATGIDTGMLQKQIDAESALLLKMLDLNLKGDEGEKNRIIEMITSLISLGGQLGMGFLLSKSKK